MLEVSPHRWCLAAGNEGKCGKPKKGATKNMTKKHTFFSYKNIKLGCYFFSKVQQY